MLRELENTRARVEGHRVRWTVIAGQEYNHFPLAQATSAYYEGNTLSQRFQSILRLCPQKAREMAGMEEGTRCQRLHVGLLSYACKGRVALGH